LDEEITFLVLLSEHRMEDSLILKLKALNTVNLEIWQRILPFTSVIPPQMAWRVDFGIPFEVIEQVTFNGSMLDLYVSMGRLETSPLSNFFPKSINFFNDMLPTASYFDLSGMFVCALALFCC
jgi:hypothetical protein